MALDMHAPVLNRRRLLQSSMLGSALVSACTAPDPAASLPAIRARADRIFDIAVCLRPFRAAGPRLDSEWLGNTLVVHNYGHGGSGWSLSWGSSTIAVRNAPADAKVVQVRFSDGTDWSSWDRIAIH